jgi:hypothetical protein
MSNPGRSGLHVSSEVLMHFRCGARGCQQWFSIADWPAARADWPHPMVYCPRCGRGWGLAAAAVKSAVDAASH